MPARNYDKILCVAALGTFLGAGAWAFFQGSKVRAIDSRPASVALSSGDYAAVGIDAPQVETQVWPDPATRAQNREWVYDVFTPPVIYYNSQTHEFSVTPPTLTPVELVEAAKPFGVELVEVKLNPFRLQLVGYVGGAGNYRGMFENTQTQETVLGRAGKSFPELGLTVRSFEVTRQAIPLPDSMPVNQLVAMAVVVDDQTGETTTLSTIERRVTGSPSVRLRLSSTGEEREEKFGAVFTHDGATYRVGAIVAVPPSVEVTKESADQPEPRMEILTPATGPGAETVPAPAPAAETPAPFPPSF